MKNIILKNGIRLVWYRMENVHSVVLSVCFKGGAEWETAENCGIAHLTEHMFFRRLNNLSQNDLYRLTEEIGSDLRGTTYKEMMRFSMKIRPQFISESLHIMKQLLCSFEWTERELEQERQVVLRELDEKYFDMSEISDKEVFKDTPAAIPVLGTYESIMGITCSGVNKFRESLCSTHNTTIIVTGNISDTDIEFIKREFEEIKMSENIPNPTMVKSLCYLRKPDILVKPLDWDNAEIRISFDIPSEMEEEEIIMLNSILGGGTGSRLQLKLREKMGITSDIYSRVISVCKSRKLYIDYTVENEEIYASFKAVKNVLNEIKKNITGEEIKRNAVFFADNAFFDLDDSERINEILSWYMIGNPGRKWSLDEICEKYRNITIEKLKACADKVFVCDNTTVILAGDTQNILPQKIVECLF